MKKVLIVEDEFIEAKNLERMLLKAGYDVSGIARSVGSAEDLIAQQLPEFVLIDIFLKGDRTGIDLARILQRKGIPFLFLSANSNKSTLDAAKSTRPSGFLVKPFKERDVLAMLEIAIYQNENGMDSLLQGAGQVSLPKQGNTATRHVLDEIIGKSEELALTLRHLRIVAPSETSVLVLGESGTGKEMIAQAVHELSPRKGRPFIKVNCATLPATLIESILFGHEKGSFTGAQNRNIGKFEQADNGTLFLDEIGELPTDVQAKLLRALQEKEIERLGGKAPVKVNVRIIAATNRNLERELAEGRFRMDLYYRLNVFPIHLSPLRQRRSDILLLAEHFIAKFCDAEKKARFEIPPQVVERMLSYNWPGNIRELENMMKRLVLLYPHQQEDLVNALFQAQPYGEGYTPGSHGIAIPSAGIDAEEGIRTWQEYERHYILYVLKRCGGRISGDNGAAKFLDLPATTLESRMKRLGIRKEDYATS
ncbi:sigma-54-dependent transcriptional regulator [Flavihumibacter solisilvae]|uniref:Fis family transcriptional regulator n=1 Tax=Flavihumibacter solisilvae TaxID=1349421 RepID=A0A0C1IYB2_9BACT|nr:sigma-54 dependent transcriptional regulator [Flavihumibacter solisilvae]KIC95474.1 Fis family transcriptional regulator [Flavihumibacter solisilvae]